MTPKVFPDNYPGQAAGNSGGKTKREWQMEGKAKSGISGLGALGSPHAALTFAALFWAGNFIAGRALRGEVPPLALNFWRWTLALGILMPLALKELRRHRALLLAHWKLIVALGATGIATFQTCVYTALTETTAINALIVLSVSPMVIACMAWAVFGEPVDRRKGAGIFISLAGALVILCRGDTGALTGLTVNRGDLWMGLGVFFWSVYSVLLRKCPGQLPQLPLLTSTAFVGVSLMLPAYLYTLFLGQSAVFYARSLAAIAYIVLFASVLAFFFWNYGVSRIGPVRAGIYLHLMPFFGALLSVWVLGEKLAGYHAAGALLIGWGIWLGNVSRRP